MAEVLAEQTKVVKAFETLGFKSQATLDDYFLFPDGDTRDVVFMTMSLRAKTDEFLDIMSLRSVVRNATGRMFTFVMPAMTVTSMSCDEMDIPLSSLVQLVLLNDEEALQCRTYGLIPF